MASNVSDDLWRECAAWLTRCKAIPVDHMANMPDSEAHVLALTLRDGVILCNLLNTIDPSAFEMKDFNRKPQMAQMFLDICKNVYGLEELDLFEPTMLYDFTNFHQVLITLSKLSQTIHQIYPNLPGFSVQNYVQNNLYDEDDYESFYSTMENEYCYITVDAKYAKQEEVYQKLCEMQTQIQPQPTSPATLTQRDFIIRELVETENKYVELLQTLKVKFMDPMQKHCTDDELRTIFPKIKELVVIHEQFLKRLQNDKKSNFQELSTILLDFQEHFLIYGEYCVNFPKSTDTLAKVHKQNQAVRKCMEQNQEALQNGMFELQDLLAVPFQRFLKYRLFVDRLIQNTTPTQKDYRRLEEAKKGLEAVNKYSNELIKEDEELDLIQKCQEQIYDMNLRDGNILRHYGRYLLDGEISVKSDRDQEVRHVFAFLFEKILILTKASKLGKKGMFAFVDAFYLRDYSIEILLGPAMLNRENRFTLLLRSKQQFIVYTLFLKNGAIRNKWLNTLQNAMDNLEPILCRSTNHEFELTTFDTPTTCKNCSKLLKGFISQGFKCKSCDSTVHRKCITSIGNCKKDFKKRERKVCDEQLSKFYWFAGLMSKETASALLISRKIGTYLLRIRSPNTTNPKDTMYRLSLKTQEDGIKHLKIMKRSGGNSAIYNVSSIRYFKSISELVLFYERNSLEECFPSLKMCLLWPFNEVYAVAVHGFSSDEPNRLSLKKNDKVLILGKEGEEKGWWRGRFANQVGFFPKEYVHELPQERIP